MKSRLTVLVVRPLGTAALACKLCDDVTANAQDVSGLDVISLSESASWENAAREVEILSAIRDPFVCLSYEGSETIVKQINAVRTDLPCVALVRENSTPQGVGQIPMYHFDLGEETVRNSLPETLEGLRDRLQASAWRGASTQRGDGSHQPRSHTDASDVSPDQRVAQKISKTLDALVDELDKLDR